MFTGAHETMVRRGAPPQVHVGRRRVRLVRLQVHLRRPPVNAGHGATEETMRGEPAASKRARARAGRNREQEYLEQELAPHGLGLLLEARHCHRCGSARGEQTKATRRRKKDQEDGAARHARTHCADPRSSGCPTAGMSRPPSPVAPGTRAQHADSGAEATGARATKSGAYAQRRAGAGRVTYQRRREVRQRRAPASPRAAPAVLHRQPWCRALTVCLRRAPSPELTKPQKAGQNLGQHKIVARLDHWSSLWGLGGQVRVEIGGKDGSGRR